MHVHMRAHLQACTCTCTCACMHGLSAKLQYMPPSTNNYQRSHLHIRTHIRPQAYMPAPARPARPPAYTHTRQLACLCTHTHARIDPYIPPLAHTRSLLHNALTKPPICSRVCARARPHAHPAGRPSARIMQAYRPCMHTCAHMSACTHTHTCLAACILAHVHTCTCPPYTTMHMPCVDNK